MGTPCWLAALSTFEDMQDIKLWVWHARIPRLRRAPAGFPGARGYWRRASSHPARGTTHFSCICSACMLHDLPGLLGVVCPGVPVDLQIVDRRMPALCGRDAIRVCIMTLDTTTHVRTMDSSHRRNADFWLCSAAHDPVAVTVTHSVLLTALCPAPGLHVHHAVMVHPVLGCA